jgi:hypothetical protein
MKFAHWQLAGIDLSTSDRVLTLVMIMIWAIVTARLIALVSYISFNFS